jgi:hypothetical protein
MDALTLLKNDHKDHSKLFRRFEKAGDRAFVQKQRTVDQIIEELSVHISVKEQLFYPVVRVTVPGTEELSLKGLEEHHVTKWLLSELDGLDPHDERFDPKVAVLIDGVRRQADEEEAELFPKIRDELGRNDLGDLGDAMEEAKVEAPTSPHPQSPDEPPANGVAAVPAAIADKVGDTVSGVAQGAVLAIEDLIARITSRKRPTSRPTGSRRTRSTAKKVRTTASDATDAAKREVRDAARRAEAVGEGAADTAKTAKAGAKGTATSARKGASKAATTAKRGASRTASSARKGASRTAASARKGATRTATTAKRGATATKNAAKDAADAA